MNCDLDENTLIARASGGVYREQEGVMYLMEQQSARCLTLNPTGTALWRFLDHPQTLGQIADLLTETFQVERQQALEDSIAFTRQLEHLQLLQLNPQD